MEYQPELGTVLDLANDSNSGKYGLCSRGSQAWLRDQASYRRPFFFFLSFLSSSTVLFGVFFSFTMTYWGSFLRLKHLLRAVGWEAASLLLRLATCICEGCGVRVGGPGGLELCAHLSQFLWASLPTFS